MGSRRDSRQRRREVACLRPAAAAKATDELTDPVESRDVTPSACFSQPDPVVDEAWGREIDRRLAELESGTVKGIPAEEVMARARKLVGL